MVYRRVGWLCVVALLASAIEGSNASAACSIAGGSPGDLATAAGTASDARVRASDGLLRLEAVGHVGGPINAVACADARCYVGMGNGLGVVDVSDLSHPQLLGATPVLPGPAERVVAAGDRAFVLAGGQVAVVTATDPAAPRIAGSTAALPAYPHGQATDLAVSGSYAFVVGTGPYSGKTGQPEGGWLHVVDATDSARPHVASALELPDRGLRVHLAGDRAYIAADRAGVLIIDVADPAAPRELGAVTFSPARTVWADGERLFITDGNGNIRVVDVRDPRTPRLLGSWSGDVSDVEVAGDRAFALRAALGVMVLDVTEPATIVAVGDVRSFGATALDVVDGTVFLAGGDAGLSVIDTASLRPGRLVGAADVSATPLGVHVAGEYAYVAADTEGLRIMDVSDPTRPHEVGAVDTPGRATSVVMDAVRAYVADGDGGLRIVDVRDRAAPREVGAWTEMPVLDVAVAGGFAYVVDWQGVPAAPELSIIDVSDPAAPRRVGRVPLLSAYGFRVQVAGRFVFVLSSEDYIRVVDVSDPTRPTFVPGINASETADFVVSRGHLFIVTSTGALSIVDVTDLTAARVIGTHYYMGRTDRVRVVGDVAYVTGRFGTDGGRWLRTFDLSDPSRPRETGLIELPGPPAAEGGAPPTRGDLAGLAVADGHAFVTTDYYRPDDTAPGHLLAIDTRDAAPAREVGSLPTVGGGAVSVADGHAYVLGGGLHVIDVADPSAPREVATVADVGGWDVRAVGGYAYVASGDAGLQIVDARDPSRAREVGRLDTPGRVLGVDVRDGYAYITDERRGLRVVDIRDPMAPTEVASVDLGYPMDVAVTDRYAFVAVVNGLFVVDIGNPTTPRIVATVGLRLLADARVVVAGNLVYIGRQFNMRTYGGPVVLDCTDPTAPRVIASLVSPTCMDVAVDGTRAYVVDRFAGLHLLDTGDPAHPVERTALNLVNPPWRFGESWGEVDVADGNVYVTTPETGLTIIRTVELEPAARVFLPFAQGGAVADGAGDGTAAANHPASE